MSNLVNPDEIERIVGAKRHPVQHLGRADSFEEIVYILHGEKCKDSGVDLRECPFSVALDRGIDLADWGDFQDRAVVLAIINSRLFPLTPRSPYWNAWLGGADDDH